MTGRELARWIWWGLACAIYVILFGVILAAVSLGSVWRF